MVPQTIMSPLAFCKREHPMKVAYCTHTLLYTRTKFCNQNVKNKKVNGIKHSRTDKQTGFCPDLSYHISDSPNHKSKLWHTVGTIHKFQAFNCQISDYNYYNSHSPSPVTRTISLLLVSIIMSMLIEILVYRL